LFMNPNLSLWLIDCVFRLIHLVLASMISPSSLCFDFVCFFPLDLTSGLIW